MVAGDREVIGKDVLLPYPVILLPVAAGVFVDTTEADFRRKVLQASSQVLQPVQRAESIKKPY
ncbi:hypothetical protein AI2991V1_2138 [Klebsiella oxytoca]|nr:hypothetical protein AI2918V1_3438 [Klebsiella oxytoca]CAH5613175.1 hypothetical protein AI2991V1_2138 [Klebsiella oxytoca]CAH5898468.1 hypothetical protein AI2918V1_3438 [Klebsiella oxytoca]